MSNLDKRYAIKLDTKKKYYNAIPRFSISDTETSDFYIKITNDYKLVDVNNAVVTMCYIDPSNAIDVDFIDVVANETSVVYCNLKPSQKNKPGTWKARLLITLGEEKIVTDSFTYQIENDEFVILNQEVVEAEKYPILTEMISRLSEIELQETSRQEAELSREEAEKLRQESIDKVKSDIAKLIKDTNSKVDTNLKENSNQVTKLISDTETKIDNYKLEKDTSIQQDLKQYKDNTTQGIDNYKNLKDAEIDKNLESYKKATTKNISDYKDLKNAEIDNYKSEKDSQIDTYVASKNKELDNYKLAKNTEINEFKDLKNAEINAKLKEVDTAEQSRVAAEQKRVEDHQAREQFLNGFESQLEQIETKNTEQDNRLKDVEYTNKRQDVYINGLFNENADGRLSTEESGNDIKLIGSKQGLVEIEKVVGNTLVNIKQGSLQGSCISYIDGVFSTNFASNRVCVYSKTIKPNTRYFIFSLTSLVCTANYHEGTSSGMVSKPITDLGYGVYSLTTSNTCEALGVNFKYSDDSKIDRSTEKILILEGNYTNKPIPREYFEGLQSTFEDKLITQEMVDTGEELAENLGKYRVGVTVRGKNLIDINKCFTTLVGHWGAAELVDSKINTIGVTSNTVTVSNNSKYYYLVFPVKLKAGKSYYLNYTQNNNQGTNVSFFTDLGTTRVESENLNPNYKGIFTPSIDLEYIAFGINNNTSSYTVTDLQIEEGTSATPYEPYRKEYKTSILLDEPLYKDNELTVHEGKLGYWKNRERKNISDLLWNNSGMEDKGDCMKFGSYSLKSIARYYPTYTHPVICNIFPVLSNASQESSQRTICLYGHADDNVEVRCSIPKTELSTLDMNGFKQWLQNNHTYIEYELAEPYFEPITPMLPKWVLDSFNDATLHIDTVIPCQSIKASYTSNVPSVYGLEETGITNTNDIAVTQTAVDFLLMSSMGEVMMMSFKNNTKGGNNMGAYFASRIMKKALKYEDVIRKYPEFKEDIDFILRSEGYGDLIVEVQ